MRIGKIFLSDLVEEMSGKRLDKSETISNWNNKVLRNEQIMYAALDAFVLIELSEWINNYLY
jgi:ribonuclease D